MKNRKMNRVALFIICTVLISSVILNCFLSTVQGASNPPIKSYITISVEPADTLWALANQYMNSDYYDHSSYIDEIIAINNINNATIFAGDNLTLPVVE